MKTAEITCKSALTKSGIEGVDYCLNPYRGCAHACIYCYATFMRKWSGHAEPWGEFVDAKVNLPEALARELGCGAAAEPARPGRSAGGPARRGRAPGHVMIGTVTDAYQPAEKRYGLTRRALEQLAGTDFSVGVLTKSALVARDLDIIARCRDARVGLTLTTTREEIRRAFEPGASPVARRLEALAEVGRAGIDTWVFFGPVLPRFSDSPEDVRAVLEAAARAGAGEALVDSMNFRWDIWRRLEAFVRERFPDEMEYYRLAQVDRAGYEARLRQIVGEAARQVGMPVRLCF